MDYRNIDNILNKYFEGISGIQEEKILKAYFNSDQVKPEHASYKPMFDYFTHQSYISNPRPVRIETQYQSKKNYKLAIAAAVLGFGVLVGVARKDLASVLGHPKATHIQVSNNDPVKKKEAIKEIHKYSENLNKGVEQTGALSIFGATTHKIFNIDKSNKKHTKK